MIDDAIKKEILTISQKIVSDSTARLVSMKPLYDSEDLAVSLITNLINKILK